MNDVLLGIDVGTSYCKAALVDADGAELGHAQVPTPWERVPTGAQADPDALVAAAATSAEQALAQAPSGRVVGIGVTGMAETGALLDAAGNVLHPAVVWHDSRGGPEAERMARELPKGRLVEIPRAVHTLHEDNPDAVLAALDAFLQA